MKGGSAQMSVVQGSREKAGDAAAQWVDTQSLGSQVGHSPAGTASLPSLIILSAIFCCFQFLMGGVALHGIDIPGA